jgi:hypothetical protein
MFEQSMRRMEEQLREAQRSAEEDRRRGEESAAGARKVGRCRLTLLNPR